MPIAFQHSALLQTPQFYSSKAKIALGALNGLRMKSYSSLYSAIITRVTSGGGLDVTLTFPDLASNINFLTKYTFIEKNQSEGGFVVYL